MELRNYQKFIVNKVQENIRQGRNGLFALPTGTGKSYCELQLLKDNHDLLLLTWKVEIMEGLIRKFQDEFLGNPLNSMNGMSINKVVELGLANRILTPIRYMNLLANGQIKPYKNLLIDEGHHVLAETFKTIETLSDLHSINLLTASPYRGTAKGTKELYDQYGKPVWGLSYKEAFDQGHIHLPSMEFIPLIDDEKIGVRNGEFIANESDKVLINNSDKIHTLLNNRLDRKLSTIVCFPSRLTLLYYAKQLKDIGVILDDTPYSERLKIIEDCMIFRKPIFFISAISEGIDYPFQQLIDLCPMYSPVKWIQIIGRIMRTKSNYICTNRNVMRHSYLLSGCLDKYTTNNLYTAWPMQSMRISSRVLGVEKIERLKPLQVDTLSGHKILLYNVTCTKSDWTDEDYTIVVHPQYEDAKIIRFDNREVGSLPDCDHVISRVKYTPSPKQVKAFKSYAVECGLKPDQEINTWHIDLIFKLRALRWKLI